MKNKSLKESTGVLMPSYTYGLKVRGNTKPSNSKCILTQQLEIFQKKTNASFYITNLTLPTFKFHLLPSQYKNFHEFLHHHPNPLSSTSHP